LLWRDGLNVGACTQSYLTAMRVKDIGVVLLHDSTTDTGEVTVRQTDGERYLFLLNHAGRGDEVSTLDGPDCNWSRVGDGAPVADIITLEACDVVVLSTARERTVDHA
jgi:hypothetical protein